MQQKWTALSRRAKIRSTGGVPPRRGKNWKAKSEISGQTETEESQDIENGTLKVITQFVETNTELSKLVQNELETSDEEPGFGIVGLHTCGDLASNSIKIFLANPEVMATLNIKKVIGFILQFLGKITGKCWLLLPPHQRGVLSQSVPV